MKLFVLGFAFQWGSVHTTQENLQKVPDHRDALSLDVNTENP